MALERGVKFDEEILLLTFGPKETNDVNRARGLKPVLWAVDAELKSAKTLAMQIRRAKLKALIIEDYNEQCELLSQYVDTSCPLAPIYYSTLLR